MESSSLRYIVDLEQAMELKDRTIKFEERARQLENEVKRFKVK